MFRVWQIVAFMSKLLSQDTSPGGSRPGPSLLSSPYLCPVAHSAQSLNAQSLTSQYLSAQSLTLPNP